MKKFLSMLMAVVMLATITGTGAYAAESVDYSAQLTELKDLMDQCEANGIPTDYEQVSYATIERFADYINQDLEKGIDASYTNYEKACVDAIYNEAKANLQAYLNKNKEAMPVVRPDMQNIEVKGSDIYYGKNPLFSIGYGFFGMAQADIPNFQKFGVNNIQMEIGPHQTWGEGTIGWNIYTGVSGIDAGAEVVSTDRRSGSKSLNMVFSDEHGSNRYVAAERVIPCKPNTTYTLGCWSKGTATDWNAWMKLGWDDPDRADILSSSDWKEYKDTYTTGAEETTLTVLVLVENTADLYLDDFYVYEDGKNINLLSNAGFEGEVYTAVEDLKIHLNNAQDNNVAVSLLLSPHYLSDIAKDNGIPTTSSSFATFINFDINNAKAKEIIENHIRAVLSAITDYECIDSICISNEPWFDTRWFENTYNPLFRDYLLEKHGDLAGIKDAHNKYYSSTSSIKMPTINNSSWFGFNDVDALAYDWMEFNDKVFADWHKWMAGIVGEYFPNTPIHSKTMENIVMEETAERVEMTRGTDFDMFGEFSDYSGIDGSNYTEDDYYKMMFMYDYLDSSVGKPVYNSETHIIKDYNGNAGELDAFSADTTKKALTKMWQGAIHGRDISTVWAWQRHYADESQKGFFGGLLFRPDLVEGLGKMNLDFARLADEIVELQTNSNKVAIFYSKPSRLYNDSHITKMMSVYKELINNGYDVGVVTERSINKLSGYKTLIIPNATHTTQEALSAIESFVANGGKVLYSGTNVLSKNEYEKSLSNSAVISKGSTYSISALSAGEVTLKDASTGAAPSGVEWQYSVTEDRVLVNAVNMTNTAKTVDVYYNGEKLGNMEELIAGNSGVGSVTLSAYEPQLLEYNLNASGAADIKDLSFDATRKTISWNTTGGVESVSIYKYNADNTVSYMYNTSGDEYVYAQSGTYLVCPVLNDGTEMVGKVITTVEDATSINILGAKDKYVKLRVNNLTQHYLRRKVMVEILDANGNVIGHGYGNVFISPNGYHELDIQLSGKGTPDKVRVTEYDDMNNCLNEELADVSL